MIFCILQKRLRSNQELDLIERAFSNFQFFEEMKQTLPFPLFRALLQEIKYDTKAKRSILSKQGCYLNFFHFPYEKLRNVFFLIEYSIVFFK